MLFAALSWIAGPTVRPFVLPVVIGLCLAAAGGWFRGLLEDRSRLAEERQENAAVVTELGVRLDAARRAAASREKQVTAYVDRVQRSGRIEAQQDQRERQLRREIDALRAKLRDSTDPCRDAARLLSKPDQLAAPD